MQGLFIGLLFVISFSVQGQLQLHRFHQLNTENGLSSGTNNNYIFQDSRANVWISSIAGLHRYDGCRIKQYHQNGEPGDLISEVASWSDFGEDAQGRIWFTLGKSYTCYDYNTDKFKNYTVSEKGKEISSHYSWSWLDERADILYFGAGNALYYVDVEKPKQAVKLDDIKVNYKENMYGLPNGGVRLLRILPGGEVLTVNDYLNNDKLQEGRYLLPNGERLTDAVPFNSEEIFVSSTRSVYLLHLSNNEWKRLRAPQNMKIERPVELELQGDSLLIGTENNGMFWYDLYEKAFTGGVYRVGEQGVELFRPEVSRLRWDEDGMLWVSTISNGVFFTNLNTSKIGYYVSNGESGQQQVYDVEIDPMGNVVSLYFDHYTVNSKGQISIFSLPEKQSEFDEPTFIHVDKKKRVIVGTYDKMYVANGYGESFSAKHLLPDLPYRMGFGYNHIFEKDDGQYIVCVNEASPVLLTQDLKPIKYYNQVTGQAREIVQGPGGVGLLLTYLDTIHLLEIASGEVDTFFTQLPPVNAAVYHSEENAFWIGTLNGLYSLRKQQNLWELERDSKVGDGNIMSIELSDQGGVWLTGGKGLLHFTPGSKSIERYTLSDGLQGTEFSLDASLKTNTGKLFLGGRNGLNVFVPSDLSPSVKIPQIRVVDVNVNNVLHKISELEELKYFENGINFLLSNGDFSDPKETAYYYSLLGAVHEDTVRVNNGEINFRNLTPAAYKLSVWTENSDGVKSSNRVGLPPIPPHGPRSNFRVFLASAQ